MVDKFTFDMSQYLEFKDMAVCERVRNIRREDVCKHPNKNFQIKVIENEAAFSHAYLLDILAGIKQSLDEGRKQYVLILPATNAHYALLAESINRLRISCRHVHTFNMDEYADQDGNSAPREWKGGFQYYMWKDFFNRIDPALRMPESQIHFPTSDNVNDYSQMLTDLGGADVCYGGIGWCGHVAFFESHLWREFGDDIDAFLQAGTRVVDLNPITICQNCLYGDSGCSGDWSFYPPKAITIGPRELAGAKITKFWDGLRRGEAIWQRFISRLAAHGPVTAKVPASMLQIINSELILSGPVAANCNEPAGEREIPIEFPKEY